ncbi:hypothetical protein [Nitrosospira sp. Is2]|uniref:hypothetical protein n=1 Tax=Nitrosospira sp. Is2 TaxID=3080532 RepID=UPI002955BCB7|nr:hypothetical protein [Nitrosospira sp. Is2]WON73534.1 hypothetical protein R5L00_13790 [Nitrosospira sp. Is2]
MDPQRAEEPQVNTGIAELARRIVIEFCLPAGSTNVEIRAGHDAAIVLTEVDEFRVERVASVRDEGVDMFIVTSAITDVASEVLLIAVAPNEELFSLTTDEGLRSLWRNVGERLGSATMARLVAEWAETIYGPRRILEVDGAEPAWECDQQGRSHFVLHTRCPRPDGGDDIDRWEVVLGPDLLQWHHRPVIP